MATNAQLIDSIEAALEELRRADRDPGSEIASALRRIDNELGELTDYVAAGYSWEP